MIVRWIPVLLIILAFATAPLAFADSHEGPSETEQADEPEEPEKAEKAEKAQQGKKGRKDKKARKDKGKKKGKKAERADDDDDDDDESDEPRGRQDEAGDDAAEKSGKGRGDEMKARRDQRKEIMKEEKSNQEPGTPRKGKKSWWRFWDSDAEPVAEETP